MGGASRTSTVVLGLVLLLGLAQAKSLPKFSDIFGREPAGSIGLTIEFESEQKATAFENAGPVFTTATNALLTLITKKIPGDLVSVKLHTTGGSEPDGTNVNLFISIELPGLVSNLEATKIIQDNMQDQLTELAASIPSAAKTTLGIVNITGLEIGAEVPSYSFTFSATLGLQEAVEDLNFDEDKLRKMTQGLSQLLALVGGHIDLLRPASKAVVVDGTNVTINGLFTLEGFSNLPPAAVDAIKKFANEHANDAIQTIVEEFGDSFRGVEVLDVKLGFGETPEIEEAATSENIVVTIELDNAEMATALKDQQANINLLMILLEQVVAPPGTIIALADTDPLSVDGNKVMVKLKSRILGAATSAEADELIKDFIKKIDTELIPAYIEQLNEFVGKGSNLGFSTMSIKLSDAVAEEIATEENEDANTQDSEVVFTLTPEVEIDDDVINKWNAKDGSGNATLDNFVSDFETKLTQEVKDGCLTDNVAGNCNSAEVKVIGLKPVSSRRQLLATKVSKKMRLFIFCHLLAVGCAI
uniref:Uncharacterized protein n=3 Tax=Dunaliella tertiolecta TaxID=3047 RepID=A0A7S3R073_DUNTE